MRATDTLSRMFALCTLPIICMVPLVTAEPIEVHHQEGVSHGFPILRSRDGKILSTGETIQTAVGNRVTTEMVFHFRDGSLYDEKTFFRRSTLFALSDHLIQKGPFFPHPIDIFIDCSKNEITIHASDKDKEKDSTQHMDTMSHNDSSASRLSSRKPRQRGSSDGGRSFREVVRQQWNFSPPNAIREVEKYQVELSDVTARASLQSLFLEAELLLGSTKILRFT